MIEIKQQTDRICAFAFADNFVGEIPVEDLAEELFDRMKANPDDTLLLTATKPDKVVGVMTAWVVPNRDYIWVDQCWYADEMQGTEEGTQLMYDGTAFLETWAIKKGRKKLRMQTRKSARTWAKSWGFNEIMTVMEKAI